MAATRRDPNQRLPLQQLTADYLSTVLKSNALEYAANGEQAVLVVDTFTMRVLTSCLTMTDILACGYAVVDKFESKGNLTKGVGRAAYFPLHVVYYCRPTQANMKRILADYTAPTLPPPDCFERLFPCIFSDISLRIPDPMYNRASLVITASKAAAGGSDNAALAAGRLLGMARASPALARFEDYFNPHPIIPECAVEFFPLDTNMFSLEMTDALKNLYSAEAVVGSARAAEEVQARMDLIAFRLSTVCVALNERPNIRYATRLDDMGAPVGKRYPQLLATNLDAHLSAYERAHPEWTPVGHRDGGKAGGANSLPTEPATLLVLDRVDDLASVLIHDLGYQSLMGDLVHWVPGTPLSVPDPDTDGRRNVELDFDDRSDPLFRELRHTRLQNLSTAQQEIFAAVRAQTREVANLGSAATGKDYRKLTTFIAKGGESLLQYRSLVHASIGEEIARQLGRQALSEVVDLEQIMATGVDDEGSALRQRNVTATLESLLGSADVVPVAKARLLLLWLLTAEKCVAGEWTRLCGLAGLPPPMAAALLNAQYLGLPTTRTGREAVRHLAPNTDVEQERAKARGEGQDKIRHSSKVKVAVEALLGGSLDEDAFPFVRPPMGGAAAGVGAGDVAVATGSGGGDRDAGDVRDVLDKFKHTGRRERRGRKFRDQKAGGGAAEVGSAAAADSIVERLTSDTLPQRSGARVIVFFLGGVTPFEASQLEAIAAATNREIVYGGTAATSAAHLLDQLVMIGEEEGRVAERGAGAL